MNRLSQPFFYFAIPHLPNGRFCRFLLVDPVMSLCFALPCSLASLVVTTAAPGNRITVSRQRATCGVFSHICLKSDAPEAGIHLSKAGVLEAPVVRSATDARYKNLPKTTVSYVRWHLIPCQSLGNVPAAAD
jgi:hypothetical protein